jgi:hypothetical protein
MNLNQLLTSFDACQNGLAWAGDMTIEEVVEKCHRGDWLLWLAYKIEIDHRKFTLAKGHSANTIRQLIADKRSIKAVDAAIAYGNNEINAEELKVFANAAYCAACDAIYSPDFYAAFIALTAYAAAAADASCIGGVPDSNASIITYEQKSAEICRKFIGQEIIDKVNKLLKNN